MTDCLQQVKDALGKPYHDLAFLLQCLSEVLTENNEAQMAALIPWISDKELDFTPANTEKLLHLYSICFQLLNLAEVNGAVQNRRRKQEKGGLHASSGLWANVLSQLRQLGATQEQIIEQWQQVYVEPVLTAHPTEAKRPVALAMHRQLYLLLVKRENTMYTSFEHEEIKHDVKRLLHKLWFTSEIFIQKPAVESELENIIYYFAKVFPEVLHYLDFKLKQAWQHNNFNPNLIEDTSLFPKITFGKLGWWRQGWPSAGYIGNYTVHVKAA
ncbi:MAG: phosphoenolpyruvate carboxylase [Bacteroidales bacterium]|nr:phosphoenolpyruvate carboxylase [Bacteroidales bacterium]